MDKEKLNELLDSVYELEGLIHLALNRDDNPDHLALLIARKGKVVGKVAESMDSINLPVIDENVESVEREESLRTESSDFTVVQNRADEPEPIILAPLGAPEDIPEELEEGSAAEEEETLVAAAFEPLENIETPEEIEKAVDEVAGAEELAMEKIVEDIAKVSLEKERESIGVEKTVQPPKTETRGRLVFTLNDKFRFKRELFRNSEADFNNTLSYVASLDNYLEAEDYFLTELQWDPEREEVKEFLEILKRYFK